MTVHEIKIVQPHFDNQNDGTKTFELRKDDRPYKVGDTLKLRLWDQERQEFMGRCLHRRVLGILRAKDGDGIADGYCIMSTRPA